MPDILESEKKNTVRDVLNKKLGKVFKKWAAEPIQVPPFELPEVPDTTCPSPKAAQVFGEAAIASPKAKKVLGDSSGDAKARALSDNWYYSQLKQQKNENLERVLQQKLSYQQFRIPEDHPTFIPPKVIELMGNKDFESMAIRHVPLKFKEEIQMNNPKAIKTLGSNDLLPEKLKKILGKSEEMESLERNFQNHYFKQQRDVFPNLMKKLQSRLGQN